MKPNRKRIMLFSKLPLAIVLIIATLSSVVRANDTVEVIAVEYPPFVDSRQPDQGVTIKLLRELLSAANLDLNLDILPQARVQLRLRDERYLASLVPPSNDTVGVTVYDHPSTMSERRLFQLKPPMNETPTWQISDDQTIASLNYRFSQGPNTFLATYAEQLIYVETLESGLRMLLANRVDYLIGIDTSVWYESEKLQANDKIIASPISLGSYPQLRLYINDAHPQAMQLKAALFKAND